MKITSKGQVTIPQGLRDRYRLLPNTEVTFTPAVEGVLIKAVKNREQLLEESLDAAKGSATEPYTTDEIMSITRSES